jgi:hypothetical protein
MSAENELIQKLMISKKIMEKHQSIPRAGNSSLPLPNMPEVEDYQVPQAKYNLPQEYIQESRPIQQPQQSQLATKDRILTSKLPDEIKQLMIEHPIQQPSVGGPSLSNDLVDKAARLMNVDASGKQTGPIPQRRTESVSNNLGLSHTDLKEILKETVKEVLSENGLLIESVNKSNDLFTFKVGSHVFEGKVTKIKKVGK